MSSSAWVGDADRPSSAEATEPPPWLDDLRLEPAPPYLSMGLRALDLADWLTIDADRADDIAAKRRLLETARSTVFAAVGPEVADSMAAGAEVLALIRAELSRRGVDTVAEPAEHPLITAALLVQEDLAIMQHVRDRWVLTAGVVCFPSHWTVADKVGFPLDGIHVPVAHYEDEIAERVDRYHDRLRADRPGWRRNWSVIPTPALHLPAYGYPMHAVETVDPDGSPMWIRSEYQTLRRLPETDAILFTIRIQRAPLGVLRRRPDIAAGMLAAIESWDEAKRRYASTGATLDSLAEWLRDVARSHRMSRPE